MFSILNHYWKKESGVFKNIVLPQDLVKFSGTKKEQAHFLFFSSIYMRGAIISEDPFRWFFVLFEHCPELFDPKSIIQNWAPEKIEAEFIRITEIVLGRKSSGENGAGALSTQIKKHVEVWIHNARVIQENWNGDIRNVFKDVIDFEQAFARIDYKNKNVGKENGIIGMRRKIFSLFTIFLQEKEIIPIFPTPIPVDFHALRVLWATSSINFKKLSTNFNAKRHVEQLMYKPRVVVDEKHINEIMIWLQGFLKNNKIPHLNVNPAIWVLSRTLCSRYCQNSSSNNAKSYIESENLKNDFSLWPKNYKNPCGSCMLKDLCGYAIPAAPYYRWGWLVRLGERVNYPVPLLNGLDWAGMTFFNGRSHAKDEIKNKQNTIPFNKQTQDILVSEQFELF